MPFKFTHVPLNGVIKIESKVFTDDRGYFMESFKSSDFVKAGIDMGFSQDNHSFSQAGVIRGLHFQRYPNQQGKLVSVISGKIFDVAVDLRPDSSTYSKWFGIILSENNGTMLWIPPGFAHGFQALDNSHVYYKATNEFSQKDDAGIRWDDPTIAVKWPHEKPVVSEKDANLPLLGELEKHGGV
jgi:dTDP-4-dehydrorhamnose 3,5-epimerase